MNEILEKIREQGHKFGFKQFILIEKDVIRTPSADTLVIGKSVISNLNSIYRRSHSLFNEIIESIFYHEKGHHLSENEIKQLLVKHNIRSDLSKNLSVEFKANLLTLDKLGLRGLATGEWFVTVYRWGWNDKWIRLRLAKFLSESPEYNPLPFSYLSKMTTEVRKINAQYFSIKIDEDNNVDKNNGSLFRYGFALLLLMVLPTKFTSKPITKSRLLTKKFWFGLFSKSISRYPVPLKLDDIAKFALSFVSITASFAILSGSLLFGLGIFALYFGLNEIRNWPIDKLPHLPSAEEITKKPSRKERIARFKERSKEIILYLASKKDIHPGKHSRAMFTTGIGTPIFAIVSFVVFYLLSPISGFLWIPLATVILANYGGAYDGYMRSKQYPESHIRREEYKKNYALTLLTCILLYYAVEIATLNLGIFQPFILVLIASNSAAYLVFRRVLSEAWHGLIDLKGGFKKCEIAEDFEIVVPPKIRIYGLKYGPKKKRDFEIKRKEGCYDEWKEDRKEKENKLAELEPIDNLLLNLKEDINEILSQNLDSKEGLKEFAKVALNGAQSFSLTDEAIDELKNEKKYFTTMNRAHKIMKGRYESWIKEYGPRESLALSWFITEPEGGWEEIFKDKNFALQNIKVAILDKEIAELAGFSKERIEDGVFGDADTGCIIIIKREWDKLELLLKIEKARAKLEIFSKTAQKLKGKNFGQNLVTFHNQWSGYKEDSWHRQIRPVLEGREQVLMFEYMQQLFRAFKKEEMKKPVRERKLSKEDLKNLPKLLREFEQYYAFPEKLPEDLFNKEEAKNFILYNFVLKFIKFTKIAEIENKVPKTGKFSKVDRSKEFLDELLYEYSARPDLGKNIWRTISEYTKEIREKKERTLSERFVDWIDEKVLSPKVVLTLTTLILIVIGIYNSGFLQNFSLVNIGLIGTMLSMVVEGREKRIEGLASLFKLKGAPKELFAIIAKSGMSFFTSKGVAGYAGMTEATVRGRINVLRKKDALKNIGGMVYVWDKETEAELRKLGLIDSPVSYYLLSDELKNRLSIVFPQGPPGKAIEVLLWMIERCMEQHISIIPHEEVEKKIPGKKEREDVLEYLSGKKYIKEVEKGFELSIKKLSEVQRRNSFKHRAGGVKIKKDGGSLSGINNSLRLKRQGGGVNAYESFDASKAKRWAVSPNPLAPKALTAKDWYEMRLKQLGRELPRYCPRELKGEAEEIRYYLGQLRDIHLGSTAVEDISISDLLGKIRTFYEELESDKYNNRFRGTKSLIEEIEEIPSKFYRVKEKQPEGGLPSALSISGLKRIEKLKIEEITGGNIGALPMTSPPKEQERSDSDYGETKQKTNNSMGEKAKREFARRNIFLILALLLAGMEKGISNDGK
ncbi:MAG: hypothetical protein KAS87_06930, partial [Candidatus Omnitrophica bacterium]|nr:hypothetical protein [Candidatus Omnitrophota bacterium]